jgi:hypothetical protein
MSAMAIWKSKRKAMWNARICAGSAIFIMALLVWNFVTGDYILMVPTAGSLAVIVWGGVKCYRFAVARI